MQTIFVLLRPEADGPEFTGMLEEELPDGTTTLLFRYNVVRVWELPAEQILAGDLATLPLAPISRVSEAELPAMIRRMDERIEQEASPDEVDDLWAATYLLMGLIHSKDSSRTLLQGVHRMKESTTYQAILRRRARTRGEPKRPGESCCSLVASGSDNPMLAVRRRSRRSPTWIGSSTCSTDILDVDELGRIDRPDV